MLNKIFHESFLKDKHLLPSEKSTGIVFSLTLTLFAIIFREISIIFWTCCFISIWLLFLSFFMNKKLKFVNVLWFKFGLILHKIVNPIVMFLIFTTIFVPIGLIMRIFKDPLKLKKPDKDSYWIITSHLEQLDSSMKDQF